MSELSAKQRQILEYMKAEVREKGYPPSVREICDAVGLKSTSTVHGHLSRLEKKEFIALREDPDDRRRKLVYILPKGRQCNETMAAVIQNGDKKLLEGFTPEETAQFLNFLFRALHNVSPDFDPKKEESQE